MSMYTITTECQLIFFFFPSASINKNPSLGEKISNFLSFRQKSDWSMTLVPCQHAFRVSSTEASSSCIFAAFYYFYYYFIILFTFSLDLEMESSNFTGQLGTSNNKYEQQLQGHQKSVLTEEGN